MKTSDYIIEKVEELVEKFPHIKIRYSFDSISSDHVIEVTPTHLYLNDKNFANAESKIIHQFIKQFPTESIVFISPEDDYFDMSEVIFQTKGKLFMFTQDFYHWRSLTNSLINKPVEANHTYNEYSLAA